jgi:hypothetical protein
MDVLVKATGTKWRDTHFAQLGCPKGKVQDVLCELFTPFCGRNIQLGIL